MDEMSGGDFARIGDLNAPIGSMPWCRAAHLNLTIHKKRTDQEVSALKYGLREFRQGDRWKQLTDENNNPFRSWKDYVTYREPFGLGMTVEEANAVMDAPDDRQPLQAVLAAHYQALDQRDRLNLRRPGRPSAETVYQNTVVHGLRPTGRSTEAALRRLRRDRPDIHARVLAGEITANAGMVEAGFRKRTRAQSTLKRMEAWSPEERRQIWEKLCDEFRDG